MMKFAAAINRADTLQRKGLHPSSKAAVPSRVSNVLESSKLLEKPSFDGRLAIRLYIVTDLLAISFVMFCESWQYWNPLHYSRLVIRRESTDFNAILYVCALLSGGGYAEKVAVPAGQVLLVPSGVSLKDAAGETFQVHGGSIGIGTFAIQIAKYQGARVFVTADVCINYKTEDFVAWVEETGGKGVAVILDNIGRAYFEGDIDSLNVDGRLFIIGFQGGTVAEVNLSGLLARCLTVQAAGLRNRSLENKAVIVSEAEKNVWPAITGVQVFSIDMKI
ncbi:Quinone oxidoreductase PIG3 [Vitis vinifera]|uniref:Quinone oxidoreductase PIG3 n=1 Tax=Vitis vinifera TaxID=29760 RepID=A0A438DKC9_VITVI|nr:Quinone oxidoreductase PIG3 [Vitis vinifera]